jgi:hypothetical protein
VGLRYHALFRWHRLAFPSISLQVPPDTKPSYTDVFPDAHRRQRRLSGSQELRRLPVGRCQMLKEIIANV